LKTAAYAALIVLGLTTILIDAASPAYAQTVCPVPASKAIDEAQKILEAGDQTKFDVALACLTLALAQMRAELDGLRNGSLPFTGQIYIPKGYVIAKPPVQEGC
jgi:hypothetical protein